MSQPQPALPPPVQAPFSIPNFRYLWLGQAFIASGIQFYAVVLVWLVLDLTGSGLNLGSVLTFAAVPRAAMMLLSGAIIDRSQPRRILIRSALTSAVLVSVLSLLLTGNWLQMTHVFLIAGVLGLTDAFFYPTAYALTARLVAKSQLAKANALLAGADGMLNILAPSLSGIIVGAFGLPAALVLNTLLFAAGGAVMWRINQAAIQPLPADPSTAKEPLLNAVSSGLRYAWNKPAVRLSLLSIAMLNFAALGPTVVGGAILVERRFGGDASWYGVLLGAFGVGALLGSLLTTQIPEVKRPGLLLAWIAGAIGVGLIITGYAESFWVAFAAQAIMGVSVGVGGPFATAWLQGETEPHMQGRMASLLTFAAVAVDPFSNGISGVVSEINLTLLFVAAGVLMLVTGYLIATNRVMSATQQPVALGE